MNKLAPILAALALTVAGCGTSLAAGHQASIGCAADGAVHAHADSYNDGSYTLNAGTPVPFHGGFDVTLDGTQHWTLVVTASDWPTFTDDAGPCTTTTTSTTSTTSSTTTTTCPDCTPTQNSTIPDNTTTTTTGPTPNTNAATTTSSSTPTSSTTTTTTTTTPTPRTTTTTTTTPAPTPTPTAPPVNQLPVTR